MFHRTPTQSINYTPEKIRLLSALTEKTPGTDAYNSILDQLSKLDKLDDHSPKPISNDTKFQAAANIAGILLVINHERANVIASKAMSMLPRLR